MEPTPTLARYLVEVHASFHRAGRQRRRDVEPAAAVGPGDPYSVCQGPDGCVDESCQQFYTSKVIAEVLCTAMRELDQGLFDEVANVVVGVSAVVGASRVIRPR